MIKRRHARPFPTYTMRRGSNVLMAVLLSITASFILVGIFHLGGYF